MIANPNNPMIPPVKEEVAAVIMAAPPRPLFVNSYPSLASTTEGGSLGIFMRIALTDEPYWVP
jgi:hypothetical protein